MKHISHRKPSQTTGMLHLANPLQHCPSWATLQEGSVHNGSSVFMCIYQFRRSITICIFRSIFTASTTIQSQQKYLPQYTVFSFFPSVVYLSPPQQKQNEITVRFFNIKLSIFHSFPTFICQKRPVVPRFSGLRDEQLGGDFHENV